jgi:ATP/maltotriose-dependent transcriptional regulator MalT
LYREIGSPDTITLYNCLTRIARRQERFGKAIHYVEAALELSRQRRDTVNLVLTLSSLAGICSAMGQAQRAVQLFGAAESLQTGITTRLPMSLREDTETTFEVARKDLDEATFDRIWAEGYAMSLEQMIACAQQTLSGLMTRSHPAQATASGEAKGAQLFPGDELTSRELEVLQLLSTGMTNQDIAGRLVITEGTVKRHTHNIFAKLGVQNRTQALLRARELALL